jgi:hypothetical protein
MSTKGYVLRQPLKVEALGAVFKFQPPTRSLNRFMAAAEKVKSQARRELVEELGRSLGEADEATLEARFQSADAPPEILDCMVDLFLEGVQDWTGVYEDSGEVDEDGDPIPGKPKPCNRETKLEFPWEDTITVAVAFLETWGEIQGKKAKPVPTPTDTTPTP